MKLSDIEYTVLVDGVDVATIVARVDTDRVVGRELLCGLSTELVLLQNEEAVEARERLTAETGMTLAEHWAQAATRSHIAADAPGSGHEPSTASSGVNDTPPANDTVSRSTTRGASPESATPHEGHSRGSESTRETASQQPQPTATTRVDTEEG